MLPASVMAVPKCQNTHGGMGESPGSHRNKLQDCTSYTFDFALAVCFCDKSLFVSRLIPGAGTLPAAERRADRNKPRRLRGEEEITAPRDA